MPENPMTTAARKIDDLEREVRRLSARRDGYTLGDVYGTYLMMNGLRGFWPFSSWDQNSLAMDFSPYGRHLSWNTSWEARIDGRMPYAYFPGAGYLYRGDEAGIQITGALTVGGWFYWPSVSSSFGLLNKDGGVGSQGYWMYVYSNGAAQTLSFGVGVGGSYRQSTTAGASDMFGAWHFCVGRFTPSTEIALFYDDLVLSNTTTIPAAITNPAVAFVFGKAWNGPNLQGGRVALGFLSASALPDSTITHLFTVSRAYFAR